MQKWKQGQDKPLNKPSNLSSALDNQKEVKQNGSYQKENVDSWRQ